MYGNMKTARAAKTAAISQRTAMSNFALSIVVEPKNSKDSKWTLKGGV
jgi:hypothetical protein